MSKVAIKKMFEDARRRKMVVQAKIKETRVENPMVVLNEQGLKDAFEVIRYWDGSYSELISFYNNLDEDQYQYILANRDVLSYETKITLWPHEFNPPLGKNSKLKVYDLSEDGYLRILLQSMKTRQKLVDERIEKLTIPSMPKSNLEDVSNNLKRLIETKEKQLEDVKKSIDTSKYVTALKRISVVENNPAVVSLVKVIQDMKNELEKIDRHLKVLKDEWESNEKFKLRHKIEQELALSGL